MLTVGLVDETRQLAKQLLSVLSPHVAAGLSIVGLEPSSLLMLRDEYKTLGLGQPVVALAKQALLFEEFIAAELTRGGFQLPFQARKITQPVLIHGHCHQKAIGAMKSVRRVLKTVPELEFSFIESSCCGMAGTYGHEVKNHQNSLGIYELSWHQAMQRLPRNRCLAAGYSCRSQVKRVEGTGVRHPLQALLEIIG